MIAITDKSQLAKGQQTIFDLDIWSGKMSPEHLVQTKEKILESSSKKPRKWQRGMPAFLDLRGGKNGQPQEQSWEMGGLLLGEYTMRSFGESPSEERGSRLSQILEEQPHPKYCLSAKACQGILNRAERRGKVLPEILKMALLRQSHSLNVQDARGGVKEYSFKTSESQPSQPSTISQCYGMSSYDSNAMKSKNPNSGIYEADTARTLDNNGGNPACNQGGMIVLEGNGARESHKGDGYAESDTMYTLNTIERHAVCIGNGQAEQTKIQEKVGTLNCMHDQQAIMTYGIDRAAFNQGKNAQYDFSVIEDQAQTIVARGPGGVLAKQ